MAIQVDSDKHGITEEDIHDLEKLGIAVRLPDAFYKYYRINDNFFGSIREGYLWMSRPEEFNDPFDARLLLDTDSSVEEIDRHISKVFESSHLKENARRIYMDLKQNNPELFISFVNAQPYEFLNQIGICCFTPKCNNLLMWAHYANNHKGVCVKFNLTEDAEITDMLFPVEYSEEYPKLNFIEVHTIGNFEDLYLTKSNEWKYEDEWRIVRTEHLTMPDEKESAEKNYGKLQFDKKIITEVIFGCKSSDEEIEKVIRVFKNENYRGIVFKKAEMIDFKFAMNFSEIETI